MDRRFAFRTCLLILASLAVNACGPEDAKPVKPAAEASHSAAPEAEAHDLATLLAAEFRSEADRARDPGRHPVEVIEFLGIEPGMRVLDVMAGGGWYTEVLSLAVGSEGHVTSHNTAYALQMRDGANEKELNTRIGDGRLTNVTRLNKESTEISADDGPFDAAVTAMNLHDIYNNGGDQAAIAALRAVYAALKPGGVYGVIDHQGVAGRDNKAMHRMVKADAIRVAEAAGFVVEGDSGILHHHSDDMTKHMRDDSIRGKTNRFLLKLRKPG